MIQYESETDLIAKAYRNGKSIEDITVMVGRSNTYVRARLMDAKVLMRSCSPKVNEEELAEIAKLYRDGEKVAAIADKCGKSVSTIQKRLHLTGVTMRRGAIKKTTVDKRPARAHAFFYCSAALFNGHGHVGSSCD